MNTLGGGGIKLGPLICSHDCSSKHQLRGLVWFFSLSADEMLTDFISRRLTF